MFETIESFEEPNVVYYPGIVSLPSKSDYSDRFFSDIWKIPIIRPTFKNTDDQKFGKCLNTNGIEFAGYVLKVKELLEGRKKETTEVVLIDFRVSNQIEKDIEINTKGFIPDKVIQAVLMNIWAFSEHYGFSYNRNANRDVDLIKSVADRSAGLFAFQLIISDKLLETDSESERPKAMRLFEETTIFAGLGMQGKL